MMTNFIPRVTMRDDYDVSNLMYEADTDREMDFYKGEPKPRLDPLLLDIVMQGRPLASPQSKLLQLPSEILAKIARFVAEDKEALRQLSLVNSDCRGLARACMFSEVKFDYARPKMSLLLSLLREIARQFKGPSIRDCIRKFIFKPNPFNVRFAHRELWQIFRDDPDWLDAQEASEIKADAARTFQQIHGLILNNVRNMPNLETLIWDNKFPLDEEGFSLIVNSTAHNLIFNGTISKGFPLGPPLTPPSWPLRSLHLDVKLAGAWDRENNIDGQNRPNPSNDFFKSLFQLCSQSLESLAWVSWNSSSWKPISLEVNSESFPRLRKLRIMPGPNAIDEQTMASLLSAPLKSLELQHQAIGGFKHLIRAHIQEPYRDLEELVVNSDNDIELVTQLIHKHNKLKKLSVKQNYHMSGWGTDFDRVLIPGLGKGRFNNLRSLYIQWGGQNKDFHREEGHFDIPPESLSTICELTTLEQLGLRCDELSRDFDPMDEDDFYDERTYPQWLINHENLRAHLKNLRNLKVLAIRGDTYTPKLPVEHTDYYHHYAAATDEELRIIRETPELASFVESRHELQIAFERTHLYHMLEHAKEYLNVLPKLEWMLCGQRPMKFVENAEGVIKPHPVGNQRDECKTYLGRVFGLASGVEIAHTRD
ncbi:hypothetical protein IL306_012341 [Fusarium sp. DS 682]|nr:hypothetical protein IL306_012341 [Fusarium sp. DS 682]